MIELIHFDENLQQVDIKRFSAASYTPHIFDAQVFTVAVAHTDIIEGHYITLLDERTPIFCGIVTETEETETGTTITGKDTRDIFAGILYNELVGLSPIQTATINGNNTDIITDAIQRVFPAATVDIDNTVEPAAYAAEARLKMAAEVLRDIASITQMYFSFYLIGTNRILLRMRPIRDLTNMVLMVNVTHKQLSYKRVSNYNRLVALGSGEGEDRDFVIIDESGGNLQKTFTYDLRESITHDELSQKAEAKFREIKLGNLYQLEIFNNNVYQFGRDYGLGDYVSFKTLDGAIVQDLITQYDVTIESGLMVNNAVIETGLKKNTLTERIREISEGGIY